MGDTITDAENDMANICVDKLQKYIDSRNDPKKDIKEIEVIDDEEVHDI